MTALSPTYLCFGCVDVGNNARLKAYISWACRTGKFEGDSGVMVAYMHNLCTCPADGDISDYDNPIDDAACWYDPDIPESADFLGVQIEYAHGVRSAGVKRDVQQALAGGSVLGQMTTDGKQMVLEVIIVATSKAGQNFGIQWMNEQFEGNGACNSDGATCSSCQGQLLTIRTHCYDGTLPLEQQPVDKGLHSWSAAAIIDGFVPDEDRAPAGMRNCEKLMAGSLTIATEQRESYSADMLQDPILFDTSGSFRALGVCADASPASGIADPRCPTCMVTCDPCMSDPGCDCPSPLLDPEIQTQVSSCFTDPLCRCIAAAQLSNIPSGYSTTMRLRMRAGWNPSNPVFQKFGLRNAVIRIWELDAIEIDNGIVMPTNLEQYEALAARIQPCAQIGIAWMPAGSELVIDGISGQMWLLCNGKCYDHSSRVHTISGSVFPLTARCNDVIFTMEWDCMNVQGEPSDTNELSSLEIESYLEFKL